MEKTTLEATIIIESNDTLLRDYNISHFLMNVSHTTEYIESKNSKKPVIYLKEKG